MVLPKRFSSVTHTNPVGTVLALIGVIFCLVWVTLWVRSYWWEDGIVVYASNQRYVEVGTAPGAIQFATGIKNRFSPLARVVESQEKFLRTMASMKISYPSRIWGRFYVGSGIVLIPTWFAILFFATIAAMPRVRWLRRLGARTLLLIATLVASGVATIIALSRE